MQFSSIIAKNLNLQERQVANTIKLLSDGATIPFISRYRKEMTGELNELEIQEIQTQYEKFTELEKRKEFVLANIEEQGKLTPEIRKRIIDSTDLREIEDIYLPFKPKRKTKAEEARKNGLEPLAKILMKQNERDVESRAQQFINDSVPDAKAALQGARDIIAEWVSEHEAARNRIRSEFAHNAVIQSKVVKNKESEAEKYKDYFDAKESLRKISSHRLLAMRRGESEGFLRVNISPDDEHALERIYPLFVRGNTEASQQVQQAIDDSYKRLIKPSIENEFAAQSKEKADDEAIRVFADNLRQLLLAPPLGEKRVMGIDPGFRTGCKVVCLDAQGNLLHHEAIYPNPPQNQTLQAMDSIFKLTQKYNIEAISIGNGTASRETESFIRNCKLPNNIQIFVVSENGASIYSASAIAREEFPNEDVTVRGAVSIARRLMDPLAELVKIDAKSIGVGQYQHDVDQTKLKKALDQTVINSVNLVGVNLNTASKHLLTYVSGLGPQLAQNIVDYRAENGAFSSRKELQKVPRLGAKAYEQCAGFLRIPDAKNPLDNTAVHPESYPIVEKMAKDLRCTISDLISNKELCKQLNLSAYTTSTIGLPTLRDIMSELEKPGRDCRETITEFAFDPTIQTIDDVKIGAVYPGIVTNITNFGAFVDIGVHDNGLVHISQMANRFISNPADVVSLHQHVAVKVLDVDTARKRIALQIVE
ncbi:MAG: RNA-binding transcriptional accessory protein [Bacteroidales bacterium]|nr:RNA-binding transcriptional accessory protein [Bacteroidales bacterium]